MCKYEIFIYFLKANKIFRTFYPMSYIKGQVYSYLARCLVHLLWHLEEIDQLGGPITDSLAPGHLQSSRLTQLGQTQHYTWYEVLRSTRQLHSG